MSRITYPSPHYPCTSLEQERVEFTAHVEEDGKACHVSCQRQPDGTEVYFKEPFGESGYRRFEPSDSVRAIARRCFEMMVDARCGAVGDGPAATGPAHAPSADVSAAAAAFVAATAPAPHR